MPVLPAAESTNANIVPIGLQAIDDDDEQSQDEIQRWSNSSCSTSSRGDGGEEDAAANARQLEQQTSEGPNMLSSKANIIAMLEDWAMWEKSLEDAAEQGELAWSIKEAADRDTSSAEDGGSQNDLGTVAGGAVAISLGKGNVPFVSDAIGVANGTDGGRCTRPTMPRQRSLRSRPDSIAKPRYQASRAWTAERIESRSPDATGDSTQGNSVVKLSTTAPEWDSPMKSLRHSFSSRMTMSQENMSNWDGPVLARHNSKTCQQQVSVSAHISLCPGGTCLRHDLRPWRTNMKKTSGKLSVDANDTARTGAETALLTPRSPQNATDTSLIRRPSPWAQSPSRETAGGVLVNQSFFYGSGGRLTPARLPDDRPNFEAGWMRQFREELQNDSEWWARRDTFHQRHDLPSRGRHKFSSLGEMSRSDGAVKRYEYNRRGNSKGGQAVDLWKEVHSRVARRTFGEMDHMFDGDARTGSSKSEDVDMLSIQDRLRYTPLSQGTWIIDRAAKVTPPKATGSPENKVSDLSSCSAGEGNTVISNRPRLGRHSVGVRVRGDSRGNYDERKKGCDAVSQKVTEALLSKEGVKQEKSNGERKQQKEDNNLQSIYDDILVKLRGEIDSCTREGIVLRAAEDATGALARARQSNAPPRSRCTHTSGAPGDALDTLATAKNGVFGQEVIDYDRVEATLSLIELASRAAGPDAGRQMLRALEGLTKIHQQVKLEDEKDRRERTGEDIDTEGQGASGDRTSVSENDSSSQILSKTGCEGSQGPPNRVLSAISSWFWKGKGRGSSRHTPTRAGGNDYNCSDQGNSEGDTQIRLNESATAVDSKLERSDRRLLGQQSPDEAEHGNTSTSSPVYKTGNEKRESTEDNDAMNPPKVENALDKNCRFQSPAAEAPSSDLSAGGDNGDPIEEYHLAWDGSSTDQNSMQQQSTAVDPVVMTAPNQGCISISARKMPSCISSDVTRGTAIPPGKGCSDSQTRFSGVEEDVRLDRSLQKAPAQANYSTDIPSRCSPRIRVRTDGSREATTRVAVIEQEDDRRRSGTDIPASRPDESKAESRNCSERTTATCGSGHHFPGTKRLCPPNRRETSDSTRVKPGITRRCALIDALHPALARQRAPPKPLQHHISSDVVPLSADTEGIAGRKTATDSNAASSESTCGAKVCRGVEEQAVVRRISAAVEEKADAILKSSTRPSSLQERRPSRDPLLAQKRVVSPFGTGERPNGVLCEGGCVNVKEIAALAGRLTDMQLECIEAWMIRVRRILGADRWKCLGSGRSSCHLREHIKRTILAGGDLGSANQRLPLDKGRKGVAVRCRQDTLGAEIFGVEGNRIAEGHTLWDELPGDWDDHLSQKTVIALEATLWILAHQHQTAAMVATIGQDRIRRTSSPHTHNCLSSSLDIGRKIEQNNGKEESAVGGQQTELRVSLLRVRRFAKACRLVDGVTIVDADVDLAVKRWEESGRIQKDDAVTALNGALASPCNSLVRHALGLAESTPCTEIGCAAYPARGSNSAQPAHVGDIRPTLCIAVGCSQAAVYGAVGSTPKASFCRKHRAGGMADFGSPRCERPDCRRLVVGIYGTDNGGGNGRVLCAQHQREESVGVEGLFSVLFALALSGHARSRYLTRMMAQSNSARDTSARSIDSSITGSPRLLPRAAANASAVRSILLALTDQSLVPGSPETRKAIGRGDDRRNTATPEYRDARNRESSDSLVAGSTIHLPTATQQRPPSSPPDILPAAKLERSDRTVQRICEARHNSRCTTFDTAPTFVDREAVSQTSMSRSQQVERTDVRRDSHSNSQASISVHDADIAFGDDEPPADFPPLYSRRELSLRGSHFDDFLSTVEVEKAGDPLAPCSKISVDDTYAYGEGAAFLNNAAGRDGSGDTVVGRVNARGPEEGASRSDMRHSRLRESGWNAHSIQKREEVEKVLRREKRTLDAAFEAYARELASGSREIALPDLLRFCDSFELRRGLVTTREILNAYKEVVFPGVLGLTDEEVGYITPRPTSAPKRITSALPQEYAAHLLANDSKLAKNNASAATTTEAGNASKSGMEHGVDNKNATFNGSHGLSSGGASSRGGFAREKRRRTTYLGREQTFPLRRVESHLAAGDRGFGLSGVADNSSPDDRYWRANAKRPSRRRRSSSASASSRRSSGSSMLVAGNDEAQEPPVAPGLSLPQFLEWLVGVILECATLTRIFRGRTAGIGSTKSETGRLGWPGGGLRTSGQGPGATKAKRCDERGTSFAKAVTFLQWMELSSGMKRKHLPAFRLSASNHGT